MKRLNVGWQNVPLEKLAGVWAADIEPFCVKCGWAQLWGTKVLKYDPTLIFTTNRKETRNTKICILSPSKMSSKVLEVVWCLASGHVYTLDLGCIPGAPRRAAAQLHAESVCL